VRLKLFSLRVLKCQNNVCIFASHATVVCHGALTITHTVKNVYCNKLKGNGATASQWKEGQLLHTT
jgi:hypothetical protein